MTLEVQEVDLALQLFEAHQSWTHLWLGSATSYSTVMALQLSRLYTYVQEMDAQLFSEYTGATQGAD